MRNDYHHLRSGLVRKIDYSISLLRKFAPLALRYDPTDGFFLAFSVGKDSQALTIFAATILSVSIQTCVWNKIGLFYLTLQLISCKYIETRELEPTSIYIICLANILVSGYLTYKGIKILLK